MGKGIFYNTIKELEKLKSTETIEFELIPDSDGNIDRECPNKECESIFKVNAEDWDQLFSDKVFCPFCRQR